MTCPFISEHRNETGCCQKLATAHSRVLYYVKWHHWFQTTSASLSYNLPQFCPVVKCLRGVLRAAESISLHFSRTGSLVAAATGTANGDMSPPACSSDGDCPSTPDKDVSLAETIELSPAPESSNSLELIVESMLSRREDVLLRLRLSRLA